MVELAQGGNTFSDYFRFTPSLVRDVHFKDDRMIRVKQRIHAKYRTSNRTILDHLMDCLALEGGERVLDIGCGNGFVLLEVARRLSSDGRVEGFDVSPGVLEVARTRLRAEGLTADLAIGNADNLSGFSSCSYDRVMANYMIHYVTDIDQTLHEINRVLKRDGIFVLSTESLSSMTEMYNVHFNAMREAGFPDRLFRASPKARICVENGDEYVDRHFAKVDLVVYEDALEFDEPEPFMEFYEVGHNYCCAGSVPSDDLRPEMFRELSNRVRRRVQQTINDVGVFRLSKRTGSFVCQDPR
jgi:ubiquinone/menaquinone biosynthesis C-methylase UbiE